MSTDTRVATDIPSYTTVATDMLPNTTMATDMPVDTTVATYIPADTTVATDIPTDTTVATDMPTNTTLATDMPTDTTEATEMPIYTTVATYMPTNTTVATDIPTYTTVATDIPTNTTVATDMPTYTTVTTYIPTNTTVATDVPSGTTVATYVPSGTTVATDMPTNTTEATYMPADTTVVTYMPTNTTVATDMPADTTVATDMPADTTVATYMPTDTTVATDMPTYTTVATDIPTDTTVKTDIPTSTTVTTDMPTYTTVATDMPTNTTVATDIPTDTTVTTDIPTNTTVATDVPTNTTVATDVPTGTTVATDMPTDTTVTTDMSTNTTVATVVPTNTTVTADMPTSTTMTTDMPADTTLTADMPTHTTVASCGDPVYRHKVVETLFIFWNVAMLGFGYGQMGPALPDLQKMGDVSLEEASWLFTGFAIGYMAGCLLAGIIREKIDLRTMLFLYTLGVATTTGVLPWSPSFIVMISVRVLNGLFFGGQDTVTNTLLFVIWLDDGGPYLQAVHCLFALGGILSPLITKPFLSKFPDIDSQMAPSALYGNFSNNSLVTATPLDNITTTQTADDFQTDVHYAFLITAILTMSAAFPFLFFSKQNGASQGKHTDNNDVIDEKEKTPSSNVKYAVLCVLLAISLIATASIDTFPNFLTTFVIAQLGWTPQDGSEISALYFGAYGFGNFIGIFILKYSTCTKLITASYVISCIGIAGVYVGVVYEQNETVWIMVTVIGVAMSAILPTLFTWTQENVTPITTRVASYLLTAGSVGDLLQPLLLGYLMDQHEPVWFVYVYFIELTTCATLFAIAFTLSRLYISRYRSESSQMPPADVTSQHQQEEISTNNTFENVIETAIESRLHRTINEIKEYPASVRL